MKIQCECGKFQAQLKKFRKDTPGLLLYYCDDCQSYLHHLGRADLRDNNGGTEIIPAYPSNIEILAGKEHLKCTKIAPNGMFRFSTTCCNTPIGNTRLNTPWMGLLRRVYDHKKLDQAFTSVKSSIMGRFAKGTPPKGTPATFDTKAFVTVMPFLLKGKLLKKSKGSPFFNEDGTPIVKPHVL